MGLTALSSHSSSSLGVATIATLEALVQPMAPRAKASVTLGRARSFLPKSQKLPGLARRKAENFQGVVLDVGEAEVLVSAASLYLQQIKADIRVILLARLRSWAAVLGNGLRF